MKLLTTNFLTCAVRTCKSSPLSYPLHFRDASLAHTPDPPPYNELFLTNILPRLDYEALRTTAGELGLEGLLCGRGEWDALEQVGLGGKREAPRQEGEGAETGREGGEKDEERMDDASATAPLTRLSAEQRDRLLRSLHKLLMETSVEEGFLVCGNCEFEYPIKDGVGNFLLPPHLV